MFDCELKFCVSFTYKDEYKGQNHAHPCYELVYYVSGNGISTIGDKQYEFEPDTFCLIGPNDFHNEIGDSKTEVLYIGFDMPVKNPSLRPGLYREKDFQIFDTLCAILNEMKEKSDYSSRMMNILTEVIVIKLLRIRGETDNSKEEDMEYILNYIRLNCMKNMNVKDFARSIGYSYDYFRHIFIKKMNITAKDYIMQERFRYARDLLLNTDNSVKDIAAMSGYTSSSHFGMVFKRETGMTPNEFQQKMKSDDQNKEIVIQSEDGQHKEIVITHK